MTIIITDTNVFIDLIQSGMLEYFFQLDYEFCTTDLVVEEVKVDEQKQQLENYREQGKLRVLSLDSTEIRDAIQLPTEYSLKGITDRSVLLKAIQLRAFVLSGDGNLRKECLQRGLEVRGSIWVIREIWEKGLADRYELIAALDQMQVNTRLPKQALEDLKNEVKSF